MKGRLGLMLLCFTLLVGGCVSSQQNTVTDGDAIGIARDYVNGYHLHDLTFTAINGTGEILYEAGDKIDPANYFGVVAPPSVRHLDNGSVVTLYSWSQKRGYLTRWDLTIKDSKVVFRRGELLAKLVGHYDHAVDGYMPSLGFVFTNESVGNISAKHTPSLLDVRKSSTMATLARSAGIPARIATIDANYGRYRSQAFYVTEVWINGEWKVVDALNNIGPLSRSDMSKSGGLYSKDNNDDIFAASSDWNDGEVEK